MPNTTLLNNLRGLVQQGLGAPILLVVMLAMIILPLPAIGLDILFTFNIALAMVVLMATVYSRRPLDFGAFPTVLLLATLLRLGLNIASTRVVLLEGHTGTAAAGQVIESFGAFVIGGSYAVGLVVFAILVIINFVVVTKGASRISEVSARFTLDALPGKQMAIDADLNSGIINQEEAKARRKDVSDEADFYGSMDGAGKFVRGDAVAGILILIINLVGGLAIGTLQHDLGFAGAMHNYALLTIGDGLVAQIPSLLLSTAAAITVTRVSAAGDMGEQILLQLFSNPRNLLVTAAIMGTLGLVPGMPNLAFLTLAGIAGATGYWLANRQTPPVEAETAPTTEQPSGPRELSWEDVVELDALGLEVGYRLIPLVDKSQGGQLMARIKGVRKKLSQDLGFLIPAVHIRDNLELSPNGYRLSLLGVTVGEADVHAERELAINSGEVFGTLPGEPSHDPVFGLDALWIDPTQRDHAQSLGYTVVDANTVIATHLSQTLTDNAHLLLGHQEVQQLLDRLKDTHPKLIENLVPTSLPMSVVVKVLQNLLRERIPIRDIRTIAESLAEHAPQSQNPDAPTAAVRISLGRFIVQQINGLRDELPIISLDPALDRILHQSLRGVEENAMTLEPGLTERLYSSLADAAQGQEVEGAPAVLLVSDALRPMLSRMFRNTVPGLHVLAFSEIPDTRKIRIVRSVGRSDALTNAA